MPPLLCTPNSVVRPRTPLVEPSQPPVTRLSSHLSQVSLHLPPHRITYLLLRLAILIACRAFSFLASHLHFICSFSLIAWFLRPCSYSGARLCSRGFFSVLAVILPLGICTNTYVSRQSEPVARKNAPCLLQSEPWFPRLSNQPRTQESTKNCRPKKTAVNLRHFAFCGRRSSHDWRLKMYRGHRSMPICFYWRRRQAALVGVWTACCSGLPLV